MMNIVEIIIAFLFLPIFLVRWVRWLAIVQQKEYRIDRLFQFLRSSEGMSDLLRLVPRTSEFTRRGMKRPLRTLRLLVVAAVSAFVIGCIVVAAFVKGSLLLTFLLLIALYVSLPVVVILACTPTAIIAYLTTLYFLKQAQQKILAAHPKVIGIGGSYGKTSTKHLLHHVLSQQFSVFVTPKSHNTKYSVARSICNGYHDQEIALLEYGAYTRGEIEYMTRWFPPTLAVETGFTLQHLGLFGSVENSKKAEAELVAALPADGIAFCNGADEGAVEICRIGREKNQVKVIEYSGVRSVVQLENVAINELGEVSFVWKEQKIKTHLVGRHYLPNIQGVIAVAEELGLSQEKIKDGLRSFVPNASFVRSFQTKSGAIIIDDGGTSNPKGFSAAIELAREIPRKKKILVTSGIVDLGNESDHVHRALAQEAKAVFQQVIYLGTNGKSFFAEQFQDTIIEEQTAAVAALSEADAETLVVIEGRIPKWVEHAYVKTII